MRLGPPAVKTRPSLDTDGFISSARFTTVVILLINAGLYAATALFSMRMTNGESVFDVDGQTLLLFGAKAPEYILAGQWWRLITAGFLHGGILHILMNSWVIFDLGATVEEVYGTSKYLVLYFVSTIGGFLASMWWSPALSVGASAALFGLIGAMIAAGMRSSTPLAAAMRAHYTQWAIWGVAIGLLPGFRTDNAAHLGGLAAGFVLGYIAETQPAYDRWSDKLWKLAAAFSVLITVAAFAMMLLFLMAVLSQR
jgi:rhomboid protease GluP